MGYNSGGNVQLDLSYATIPINGSHVKLYREPRAPRVLKKIDPNILNCMIDVDLDNFRILVSQLVPQDAMLHHNLPYPPKKGYRESYIVLRIDRHLPNW